MSERLYKLGKWVFAHRWLALSVWIVAIIAMASLSATLNKPYSTSLSIPGTEAQQTIDKLSKELPQASKGSSTVVFAAPQGQTLASYTGAIDKTVSELTALDGVANVVSPYAAQTISKDGRIAFATVQFEKAPTDVPASVTESVTHTLQENRANGLQIETRGDAMQPESEPPIGEILGVAVAAVVLLITFSSLVAAGLPLLIAIITVILGMLGVMTATAFFDLSSTTPVLATMIGLAVGIDYVLFMLVRFIKGLKEGLTPIESAGRIAATAGNAVIFAALTVVIALVALSVTGIPFLSAMGLAAAATVVIAALAALTLLPALLSFARFKVLKKADRARVARQEFTAEDHISHRSFSYRWVTFLVKKPVIVLVVVIASLAAIAVPATKMQLGLPDDGTAASSSTQRKAYDLLTEGFGAGFNAPLLVVASMPDGLSQTEQQTQLGIIAAHLHDDNNVASAVIGGISPSGKLGILQVYPKTGPNDTATKDLIGRIRADSTSFTDSSATTLNVSGATAIAVDIDNKLSKALPVYIAVVVGLSLLVLLAVFRSVVVPIKATLGFLLTIFATFGLLVMFFQWGWLGLIEAGPILSFLPILVTGILFGLAMDYQFFLVSGMHEAYTHDKDKDAKAAVVRGFSHSAKVVTIAAIIMISVFAGFIFGDDTTIRSIGFALAVGVFIDAFIVRMTIVPAVMALFGRKAWWLPAWLGKLLPNLSIEGDETIFQKPNRR